MDKSRLWHRSIRRREEIQEYEAKETKGSCGGLTCRQRMSNEHEKSGKEKPMGKGGVAALTRRITKKRSDSSTLSKHTPNVPSLSRHSGPGDLLSPHEPRVGGRSRRY